MDTLGAAQSSETVWTPSLLIAACALAFTVGSFWWLNARRGRLRCYEPHTFAFAASGPIWSLRIRFPLVLHNTGPVPLVIQDLRLRFPDESGDVRALPWTTTRAMFKPDKDDAPDLPAVFAISGRDARQYIIEFGGPFPDMTLAARDYRAVIEARLGHRERWLPLLEFTLHAAHIKFPLQYIAYPNSPIGADDPDFAEAETALAELMKRIGPRPASTGAGG